MSSCRLFFFAYFVNFEEIKGLYPYVLKAFFLGFRYDLAIVSYVNAPVTLGILVVGAMGRINWYKFFKSLLKYYYTIAYSLVFLIIVIDFGFFLYFKNHINILIFGILEDNTGALFLTIFKSYPVGKVLSGFLIFVFLLYLLVRAFVDAVRAESLLHKKYPVLFKTAFVALLLAGNFLGARGSVGIYPLGVMDAAISPNEFINKLAPTGIHTLREALKFRYKEGRQYDLIKEMGYAGNIEQAVCDYLLVGREKIDAAEPWKSLVRKTRKNARVQQLKPNVIVVMCEGFGTDLAMYNSNSFNVLGELEKHFKKDYLFTNFLSDDNGTIGSIESVVYNMPKRPQSKALGQSRYAYKFYPSGAAVPYKKAGYETVFIYGGNANWRNVQSSIKNAGFDRIEGEGAMDPGYLKNEWGGVYDEYLFDWVYRDLGKDRTKPKFIFVMTTTNHPPYSLPPGYRCLPLTMPNELEERMTGNRKLTIQRFRTYQYANQKLGEFITRVSNSEFGANTIIAATGDHNFWDVFDYSREELLNVHSVPFYIHIPDALKPRHADLENFGSHKDIMPTLYNLSLSEAEYLSLGSDMFDPASKHMAFNSDATVLTGEGAVKYGLPDRSAVYFSRDPANKRNFLLSAEQPYHKHNLRYYKAALALTDYLIREVNIKE